MAARGPTAVRGGGCDLLVAATGYGKTTALESMACQPDAVLLPARELLSRLSAASTARTAREVHQVLVDEVGALPPRDQLRLARALAELPSGVRLTLASRAPLSGAARTALGRPVVVRAAAELALRPDATALVLRELYDLDDLDCAETVHEATAGWPTLVHLAAEIAARCRAGGDPLGAALRRPDNACITWLRDHALGRLSAAEHHVLGLAVGIGEICPGLGAETLPPDDRVEGLAALTSLCQAGLLVQGPPAGGEPTWKAVPLVAAAYAGSSDPVVPGVPAGSGLHAGPGVDAGTLRRAARWFAGHGRALRAAALWHRCGDDAACVALLTGRGAEMLAAGEAGGVVGLAGSVLSSAAGAQHGARLRLLLGDAQRMTGDALGALRTLDPLVADADAGAGWTPALARSVALVHYMRGDPRRALEICRRVGALPAEVDTASEHARLAAAEYAQLAATEVVCLHAVGEESAAGRRLARALGLAERSPSPACLALAHLAAAIGATGSRRDAHLGRAGEAARRAGDVVLQTRVLVNQTDAALGQARYAEAGELALQAVRLGAGRVPPGLLSVAHENVCAALHRLGRLEEARYHGRRSVQLCRRYGLDRTASGLLALGELAAAQGRREHARLLLEEAAGLARDREQVHVLVPVLAALTRVLADGSAEDRALAAVTAQEACDRSPRELLAHACLARGWVDLRSGDAAGAGRAAGQAMEQARRSQRLPALTEALELSAAASRDAPTARAALDEARELWRQSGAVTQTDRLTMLLARLPGSSSEDRAAGREAARRLVATGVRVPAGEGTAGLSGTAAGSPGVAGEELVGRILVRVLGGFEVRAAGRVVPMSAWRSRQARTLVKILVAKRGRTVPRAQICELLWPDDEPQRTGHRLSVLLSVVRGALDPVKAWPADHYLRADLLGLSVDTTHVSVDAEELLRDADHAERVRTGGDGARARALFAEVDRLYRGDAFDEEPYEDWAGGLREEARAAWLRALRRHAELSHAAGDVDDAVDDLVRLLAADAYDESAHRDLVRVLVSAGRHGEARRAFDRWTHAMRSIDAPVPDAAVLRARRAAAPREPAAAPLAALNTLRAHSSR